MPLKAPNLDDRSFEEIKELVRARIPRYTQEWTDFNASDPGITLIELFSWLTEMMLYRMNQIPERSYIKFLKLLNMQLAPPTPAEAHLTFAPGTGESEPKVPVRSTIAAQSKETGDLTYFETETGLDLILHPLTDLQVFDAAAFHSRTEENLAAASTYLPFGPNPQVGSALYLGFTPPDESPPPNKRAFPQQLRFHVFLSAETTAGEPQQCDLETSALAPAPPVDLVWEYRHPDPPHRWHPLTLFKDESIAFTREGYIVVEGPAKAVATNEGLLRDPDKEKRYWLRCRVQSRTYPAGKAPVIDFVRANTVRARSLTTVRNEILGTSDETPNQIFDLNHTPILLVPEKDDTESQNNLTLQVQPSGSDPTKCDESDQCEQWKRVDDFLASKPDEAHFVLEAASGIIRFGDGLKGRIPTGGMEIVATHYRYGGGKAANVGAGSINIPLTTLTNVDSVTNERKAVGGRDEQDVEDLKAKAPCVLHHLNRAVTTEDFKALAKNAGGVAKATALAETHPDFPGISVPGAVTVVIVPDSKDKPPKPSAELIRYVCGYLDRYRLLTTELHVQGPEFVEIRVEAKVSVVPQMAAGTVRKLVNEALDKRLDPLDWTFGRDFNPTGLYRDIYRVKDEFGNEVVKDIPYLAIVVNKQDRREAAGLSEPVELQPHQLIYAGDHEIVVVPDLEQ
jgi:predicted phage baseplate assembly protein